MIRFERNTELDIAMKNHIRSMVDMVSYITAILNYWEGFFLRRREKACERY